VTTRPERVGITNRDDPSEDFPAFDLGPDAHGNASIVLGACANGTLSTCHLRIASLPSRPSRQIGRTAQRGMPSAATFWRGTLAWSDFHRTLHLRTAAGTLPRVVRPWTQPHANVEQTELRGDLLAATLNYDDQSAPNGNAVALALANVRTGHRETLASLRPGEGGQQFTGPTFIDGHTLSWLQTCWDSGACRGAFGVYRRDLRTRSTAFAHDRRPHSGFGALSDTTVLLGPDEAACFEENRADGACRIQLRRMTFR
jgi:hypothetical protein